MPYPVHIVLLSGFMGAVLLLAVALVLSSRSSLSLRQAVLVLFPMGLQLCVAVAFIYAMSSRFYPLFYAGIFAVAVGIIIKYRHNTLEDGKSGEGRRFSGLFPLYIALLSQTGYFLARIITYISSCGPNGEDAERKFIWLKGKQAAVGLLPFFIALVAIAVMVSILRPKNPGKFYAAISAIWSIGFLLSLPLVSIAECYS